MDNSYPDIVFVEYSPENYINWNTARDKLVKDDLKVLYHLYYRKEINATDLVSQLWITWKEAMIL